MLRPRAVLSLLVFFCLGALVLAVQPGDDGQNDLALPEEALEEDAVGPLDSSFLPPDALDSSFLPPDALDAPEELMASDGDQPSLVALGDSNDNE